MEQHNTQFPFYKRFNIEIGILETQYKFLHRVANLVAVYFPELDKPQTERSIDVSNTIRLVAADLGTPYIWDKKFYDYAEGNFIQMLRALEALYNILKSQKYEDALLLERMVILGAMSKSEIDLGIEWKEGLYYKSGAKLLDEALVNVNLQWMSAPKYLNVLTPFQKGLRGFLESQKQPEKLTDVITGMYESLEAMARITNCNNNTLGQNAEQFINNLGLSDHYRTMLREYTKYAHEFRHAVEQGKVRIPPLANEVEAFIYSTGLFLRLAIKQLT